MNVSSVIATFRTRYLKIWTVSIFLSLLALLPFVYMMQITERVHNSRSWETFHFITGLIVFLVMIWAVLDHYRSLALQATGHRIDSELRGLVFDAVHRGTNPAAFRAYSDISTIARGFTGTLAESLLDASLAPIFVAVLFLLHPAFGFVALAYIGLIALLSLRKKQADAALRAAARPHEDRAFAFGVATAAKREVVRVMNLLPGVRREWRALEDRASQIVLDGQTKVGLPESMMAFLQHIQIVLVVGTGAALYLLEEVSASAGMAAFIVMLRGVAPVVSLARNWPMVHEIRAATARLDEVIADAPPEPVTPLPEMVGALSCENLGLLAADGKPVLGGVRFALPPGSILGVVGPSGAGKSTLLRLLAGGLRPGSGVVRIDGYPLETWPAWQLGPQIGFLPQAVDLLPGTIWQNVTRFGDPASVDPAAVAEALLQAGASDIVQGRGRGLDFMLQDGGAPLSGGQRQRLGLARAFFGAPKLVVLDEPNAALDAEGERQLLQAMDGLRKGGSTVVFSTHKAAMLGICDYILVVMDGYMHSFSTRDDVLERLNLAGNAVLGRAPGSEAA